VKNGWSSVSVEAAHTAVKVAKTEIRLENFILSGAGIAGDWMFACVF